MSTFSSNPSINIGPCIRSLCFFFFLLFFLIIIINIDDLSFPDLLRTHSLYSVPLYLLTLFLGISSCSW